MITVTVFILILLTLAMLEIFKLRQFQKRKEETPQDMLVSSLVLHTANLELLKNEYVELAPMKGCCGPFKLSGASLPVFEYTVFEKEIMEFVKVRVEISKPNRIEYVATIDSVTAPKRHGELLPMKDKYKQPFQNLAASLYDYFPFYRKTLKFTGLTPMPMEAKQ